MITYYKKNHCSPDYSQFQSLYTLNQNSSKRGGDISLRVANLFLVPPQKARQKNDECSGTY